MENELSGWLWLAINLLMPIALGAALVYGIVRWSRRDKSPQARRASDDATDRIYREEERQERKEEAS